jgi:hypothetical protein
MAEPLDGLHAKTREVNVWIGTQHHPGSGHRTHSAAPADSTDTGLGLALVQIQESTAWNHRKPSRMLPNAQP